MLRVTYLVIAIVSTALVGAGCSAVRGEEEQAGETTAQAVATAQTPPPATKILRLFDQPPDRS